MRTYIVLAMLLLVSTLAHAQMGGMNTMPGTLGNRGQGRGNGPHGRPHAEERPNSGSPEIYLVVDQMPAFPGDSLQSFLDHNIRYPEQAKKDSIEGRVVVRIIVYKDGSIDTPEVIRSSGNDELDFEALRVVHLMPKWKPGKQEKKDVDAYAKVPVVFSLK